MTGLATVIISMIGNFSQLLLSSQNGFRKMHSQQVKKAVRFSSVFFFMSISRGREEESEKRS
jgi:hypothetical protein